MVTGVLPCGQRPTFVTYDPESRILHLFAETLKKHLHYRRLLGWSVDPIAYTEEFKKLGINEVSSNKGESDSELYPATNGTMYAFVLLVRVFRL